MASSESDGYLLRKEKDECYRRELSILFKNLRMQAISNLEYFKDGKGYHHSKFFASFHHLHEHLDRGIEPSTEYFLRIVHLYDVDCNTPANGYRSIIKVIHKCCLYILQLSRHITVNRDSFLFRGGHYSRELDAYVTTLGQLRACLHYLQKLASYCRKSELFPSEDFLSQEEYKIAEDLMLEVESLSQETFYGRCLGFQFCSSMVKPLTSINLMMASFSDGYTQNSAIMKLASSMIGGSKYLLDADSRAQRVVHVTRNSDIKFAKAFWSIAENSLVHALPLVVCPPMAIDRVIVLQPDIFEIQKYKSDERVKITPPCAHCGPAPVNTRLLSYSLRQGQIENPEEYWKLKDKKQATPANMELQPLSPGLIIHVHGGGFVAQSSASHEVYLRGWAKETGVPIFSVDYSLAPELPFPRQMEEVFFAYCWALCNCSRLGCTAERVCIVGDSAGANIAVAVAMRAAAYGVRPPDGVLSVYGCMNVRYTPSPSRILALMDPLLPMGILAQCLGAYAGTSAQSNVNFPGLPNDAMQTSSPIMEEPCSLSSLSSPLSSPREGSTSPPEPTSSQMSSPPVGLVSRLQRARGHRISGSGDSGFQDETEVCSADDCPDTHPDDSTVRDDEPTIESIVETAEDAMISINLCEEEQEGEGSDSMVHVKLCERSLPIPNQSKPTSSHQGSQGQTSSNNVQMGQSSSSSASSSQYRSTEETKKHLTNIDSPDKVAITDTTSVDSAHDVLAEARLTEEGFVELALDHNAANNINEEHDQMDEAGGDGNVDLNRKTKPVISAEVKKATLSLDLGVKTTTKSHMGRSLSSPMLGQSHTDNSPDTQMNTPGLSPVTPAYAKVRHFAQSPVVTFRHLPICKNPYMSPYLAREQLLRPLCPIYFVCCHLDPLLDDSIMFAKRLKSLGVSATLDILEDLPHGFLNFSLVSREAKLGSDMCVKRLREILGLDKVKPSNDDDWEVLESAAEK